MTAGPRIHSARVASARARRAVAALLAGVLALHVAARDIEAPSTAEACAPVHVLARVPPPAFLENLAVLPDGTVLFTSYLAKDVLRYDPQRGVSTFAALDAHPVSIVARGDTFVVAAHGQPFTAGPAFTSTNRFIVLDAEGRVEKTVAAPDARFLNGTLALDDGVVLAADSILGAIWRVDVDAGEMSPWLDSPLFAGDPTGRDPRPGANGLKRRGSELLVSNSHAGTLVAVEVDASGAPAGAPRVIATPGRIDDFAVGGDGTIYLATHADDVLSLQPDGSISTILASGGEGSTAVAFANGADAALYVLTTGGFLEGLGREARLLQLRLPDGDQGRADGGRPGHCGAASTPIGAVDRRAGRAPLTTRR